MRVIAGEFRGRRIVAPQGRATRPTTDRVRESLFQHLTSARLPGGFAGARVLDLFAGSGALGLEALSRGAASVTLVDHGRDALGAIRANVETLGVGSRVQVARGRLPGWLDRARAPVGGWTLVFADPPYARATIDEELTALRGLVADDALIAYERAASTPASSPPPGWVLDGERTWGETAFSFVRRDADSG